MKLITPLIALLLTSQLIHAATYYVAPDGQDSNSGAINSPFASISQAQQELKPGDTVYLRGGTYHIKESQIDEKVGIFAYVIRLDKSGTPDKRINYFAYKNERPVFDFSAVKPKNYRVYAFSVSGSWIHLKGIEVVGVQVTIKDHTQSICFENNGSNNIYQELSMHDSQAIGIYSVKGKDNLFLNCDAYNNWDFTSGNKRGGNTDGFGCHPRKGDTGNIFRGCRAWFNSDDGFDTISASESIIFENCWAFYNGYSQDFKQLHDGNGFKIGGHSYRSPSDDRVPQIIPRHKIRFCLAARNKTSGFYANHHRGGNDWLNNTAYNNRKHNYNMLSQVKETTEDVYGYAHTLHHNLSYVGMPIDKIDMEKCDLKNNSFDLDIEDQDFQSLDDTQLMRPRKANGDLPEIDFMRPAAGKLSNMGCWVKR